MPDVPSRVKVNPSKLHLSKFLCYEITKNSLVLSNELSLKASHGDKSSKRFDVLNHLETPNCNIEGQSASWRPLNNHELIRSPPLRAWEGPLRLAAPWLIVLTNWPTCETLEQPVAAQHSLFGRHLHSSDLLGRRWIMMGLPWRRPTTHHVASVSILRRWLSCYLVACQLRWSNSKEQIIFADLDQRGIQSRISPLEYLCRSRKLCQRLCSNWVQKLAVYAEDEISCC